VADRPRQVRGPSVGPWVLRVFLIREGARFLLREVCGPFASKSRTVRPARTVRKPSSDHPYSLGRFWWFCLIIWTVCTYPSDSLPSSCGPSAPTLRIVHQELCKLAMSFVSRVVLPLWGVLRRVPRVGRFVVTTRPWQAGVGILSCEFGA
jgi:hypothetical protein